MDTLQFYAFSANKNAGFGVSQIKQKIYLAKFHKESMLVRESKRFTVRD